MEAAAKAAKNQQAAQRTPLLESQKVPLLESSQKATEPVE
jgi:hypothetical protein